MSSPMWKFLVAWFFGVSLVALALLTTAVVESAGSDGIRASYPHDVLEADRIMTTRMAIEVGPSMEAQMINQGMLQRSSDPAYLEGLQRHAYEFDRGIGLVP